MGTPLDPGMDPSQMSPAMGDLPPELAEQLMAQGGEGQGEPAPDVMPDDHVDLTDIYEAIHAGAVLCKGAKSGAEFQQAAMGIKALVDAVNEIIAPHPQPGGNAPQGDPSAGGGNASGPTE